MVSMARYEVSIPYRYSKNRDDGCIPLGTAKQFQFLIGILKTRDMKMNNAVNTNEFQFLIGILKTMEKCSNWVGINIVSIPYRYSKNLCETIAICFDELSFNSL